MDLFLLMDLSALEFRLVVIASFIKCPEVKVARGLIDEGLGLDFANLMHWSIVFGTFIVDLHLVMGWTVLDASQQFFGRNDSNRQERRWCDSFKEFILFSDEVSSLVWGSFWLRIKRHPQLSHLWHPSNLACLCPCRKGSSQSRRQFRKVACVLSIRLIEVWKSLFVLSFRQSSCESYQIRNQSN